MKQELLKVNAEALHMLVALTNDAVLTVSTNKYNEILKALDVENLNKPEPDKEE